MIQYKKGNNNNRNDVGLGLHVLLFIIIVINPPATKVEIHQTTPT